MNKNDLVLRIGYFRTKANLSVRELSLRIDKSSTYINQVENDNFTLSIPMLFTIIEVLEVSCEEFFADNYVNYAQDIEALNLLKSLSTDRKRAFIDLMKNIK